MPACSTHDPRDLASNTRAAAVLWGLPAAGFLVGFFVEPLPRTVLWTLSLSVGGAACLLNALRSGRLHCYLTGPFALIGALVVLAAGTGLLSLDPQSWIWLGIALTAGALVLAFLPERLCGRYLSRS